MKIALIAPSPIPFIVGGAENLYWGLLRFINEETQHQCELIKIPTMESNFSQIIESYRQFSNIDLSHFDMVISTKYPSWMVSHKNHVCYMVHTLRGLYDTYHFMREPEAFDWMNEGLSDLWQWMNMALSKPETGNDQLTDFFDRLQQAQMKIESSNILRFPGPFIRQIVHFLDAYGMSPGRIRKYAAISNNVKQRQEYFPTNMPVSVIYPPPRLSGFRCGEDNYLFTVSRLDGPKRISLLIEAMRHVKSEIPLLIGGTGPETDHLQALAEGDQRIKFLGQLNDEQILDYYANSLAVLFVPYDEDYGYITIEAMKSGKAVITVTDAGGPNEFVVNNETGYSVRPDPSAIAERIDYLCTHRAEARQLGRNGRKKVEAINWRAVVEELTGAPVNVKSSETKPLGIPAKNPRSKIVVAVTFPVFPPRGGGQSRVFHLYRNLAQLMDVEIVSFGGCGDALFRQEIAPGLIETRIPKSSAHQDAENKYSESVGWVPVTDIVMSKVYQFSPAYIEALKHACADATVAVASHPYLFAAIRDVAPKIRIWLEAHNVEYELKRRILPDSENARALLNLVRKDEGTCWEESELVFACAQADILLLEELYGSTQAVKLEVANGVSLEDVKYIGHNARLALKKQLGFGGNMVALFMGSWHGPNLEAVEKILEISIAFPNAKFLIVGSAGLAFSRRNIPDNVVMVGVVDDEEKNVLLGAADVALNPMTSGSGSNLKMLDYFSSGIPVISTPFGARGINVVAGIHFISAEVDSLILELSIFFSDPKRYDFLILESRKLVESAYSWDIVANRFYQALQGNHLWPISETSLTPHGLQ
jgi:glycosyltransferase involved in cell wall biosynthesis